MIDPALKEYATPTELKYIEAIERYGSQRRAADALNKSRSAISCALDKLRRRAAQRGYAPEHDQTHPVPAGQNVKGISTLYDEQGNVRMQWVKSQAVVERLRDTAEEIVQSLDIPAHKPVKVPKVIMADLLTTYPMGDPHIGMYSWAEETGEDFDCEIAERDLCGAVDRLTASAEPTEKALIVNLGDFFHADNQANTTARNNNPLDVDTRKQRVMRVGVRIMVYLIDSALKRHQHVTVINEIGNHDDESSYMLSLILSAWYRKEPRVEIDLSPATFHYFRFHKVLIGVTHGHNCKPDMLGQIMATDRKEDWGETDYKYWLVGHIHHMTRKEVPGCVIESFRTLAAKDAWHASKGYRSGRDMHRITYHKDYGEVGREVIGIKQIVSARREK